ncbi:cation channel sperm-associated protein subunit gamma [Orycteropus afer afer]|uniref:Cation channel sperm-associated protein subunit gamma n=1 Tax=Orycteropus afer afer TaxID=1230840 RepID=A0AC54ZE48_ORYAF|nr:cation channel sperm-associated protein subunit gamma [Orycteropus afer afer]
MEREGEKRGRSEQVSRAEKKVRIQKVHTDKSAPAQGEKRAKTHAGCHGEDRAHHEEARRERARVEKRVRGEKVQGEKRRKFEERARGERTRGEKVQGEERAPDEENPSPEGRVRGEKGRGEGRVRGERGRGEGRVRGERGRGEETTRGEENCRGAERARAENGPGEERAEIEQRGRGEKGLGEEPAPEEQVAKGEGKARNEEQGRGCSHVPPYPTMFPAVPSGQRPLVLQVLWALLTMVLAPWRLWAVEDADCTWHFALNKFEKVGQNSVSDRLFQQKPVDTVESVFRRLVDAPIDLNKKYLGFPYYLKINYSCAGEPSEALVRKGHLTGLKPVVLVTFHSPVNFRRWKIEQLQIQMEAAPLRNKEACDAEVCAMNWYTPMPIKNGSVVMSVDISSNGLGPLIPRKRFFLNINGYIKMQPDNTLQFTVGNEVKTLNSWYFMTSESRPLWYTVDQAPVLILGGIPDAKSILMTDTNFEDFSLIELSIDSCWVASFYCPQTKFSATIYDTIATESTLFIRQNQLVYYFTGTYPILQEVSNSGSWVRVLANECIQKLCPVEFHSNGSEYVMALPAGKNEGYVYFGTITDGSVTFEMLPRQQSVCQGVQVTEELSILYEIPEFIPNTRGPEFLMIQRAESYTNTPLVPQGMSYNPYNNLLFIWGNVLLQSYDHENYIYVADFPKESSIKYLVNSFRGDLAVVTVKEEIWYLLEGSFDMYKLFPSEAWSLHFSLQVMFRSSLYTAFETMITLFYEHNKLYQLVYLTEGHRNRLVKRLVPVEQLLIYLKLNNSYVLKKQGKFLVPTINNYCPFTVMRLQDLPNPQRYTRQERYRALPPGTFETLGFHNENSLAVYQGLVYYLLWLHSKYDKPYADPVHDPTWRWWKNKKQDQSYYFYLSSNWQSSGGVYIDMDSYGKIYNLKAEAELPERIFLDKDTFYTFSVLLTTRDWTEPSSGLSGTSFIQESQVSLGVVLAHPHCIKVAVTKKSLISRSSVSFEVTLRDKSSCFNQGLTGHHLKRTSMLVKVVGAAGHCFQNTHMEPRMAGNLMVPVLIGCPPGKRLAFDITLTLSYYRQQNKHYFDCLQADPEMPCFLFRNTFYPFFLVQDLVTGESGRFLGSYVFKVVGGGPTRDNIRDYSEEEIFRYNSPLDETNSLIWTVKNRTPSMSWRVKGRRVAFGTRRTLEDRDFHIIKSDLSVGIEWLCLENSPCHDTVPQSIFSPEFFFKVLVSNRGVDKSTYCDYQLIFLLHIHGIPLSAKRSLFILMVSISIFVGLVVLYLLICFLWPLMVKACSALRWKINSILASESYYSCVSSSSVLSSPSIISFKIPTKDISNMAEKDKAEPEQTLQKKSPT